MFLERKESLNKSHSLKGKVSLSHVRLFATPWTVAQYRLSVPGVLQARILERVTISFSGGSSRPRNQTWVSCVAGRFFTVWAAREDPLYPRLKNFGQPQGMRLLYYRSKVISTVVSTTWLCQTTRLAKHFIHCVLVCCSCHPKYHKLKGLKQQKFPHSQL